MRVATLSWLAKGVHEKFMPVVSLRVGLHLGDAGAAILFRRGGPCRHDRRRNNSPRGSVALVVSSCRNWAQSSQRTREPEGEASWGDARTARERAIARSFPRGVASAPRERHQGRVQRDDSRSLPDQARDAVRRFQRRARPGERMVARSRCVKVVLITVEVFLRRRAKELPS